MSIINRSLVLIKPEGVQRNIVGELISRYEKKGLKMVAMKLLKPTKEIAEEHYSEHKERPFFGGLVKHITSGPLVALVFEGRKAIKIIREINGATNPDDAAPGTIRGDYAVHIGRNVVHASDAPKSAAKEIAVWFNEEEIVEWGKVEFHSLYDEKELKEEEEEIEGEDSK